MKFSNVQMFDYTNHYCQNVSVSNLYVLLAKKDELNGELEMRIVILMKNVQVDIESTVTLNNGLTNMKRKTFNSEIN